MIKRYKSNTPVSLLPVQPSSVIASAARQSRFQCLIRHPNLDCRAKLAMTKSRFVRNDETGHIHMGLICALMLIISIILLFIWLKPFARSPQEQIYIVESGESVKNIAHDLQSQHIIPNANTFVLFAYLSQTAHRIQAGEYLFEKNSSLLSVLDKMIKGDVVMHQLRIGEGWTFNEIAAQIQSNEALTKTLDWSSPQTIVQQLKLSTHVPEGLFYPETYSFARGYTDAAFLRNAYQQMQTYLVSSWEKRAKDLPYKTPYQALIAASIIEKETGIISEQAEISGVIVRRLQKHMPLQMDPTVVYGLGAHYDQPLTKADLLFDTPYNTYLHLGLPPTPIAIPSLSAIDAAMHPKPGNSLYFVAKGDGGHIFSDTLSDHNKAVQSYRSQLE